MEPVRGWCFTLSSSFCVTFLSLFQTHILNIHVYLKATSISSPFLSHFLLLHLLSALTCLRVSLLLPPPLLIQMKMYLGCMTDSSMVSAFSTLFNFKSTTHNLLAGIYVKDVTASQDQWYRMLQWKLKILFFFFLLLTACSFLWILILRCWPYVASHAFNMWKAGRRACQCSWRRGGCCLRVNKVILSVLPLHVIII